jgi:transcriptional regulator with XRE-family HTH domain
VREARKRAGLTQAQLAAKAGTTQSAIARVETDAQAPTLEQLTKLLRACGFDLAIRLVRADPELPLHVADALARSPEQRVRRAVGAANRLEKTSP